MRYFHISNGLRGCYMPDSAYVAAFKTRRALREAIAEESKRLDMIGGNKRAIAFVAAGIWRDKKAALPYCLPLRNAGQDSYSYGVFVGNATRAEFKEWESSNAD